ncbi:MAG: helix-turn-helix domain-containing protein [Defluviitaleaceae bacterium]|nr:helix-turn-helix domain-containing protein [Defluviitaleaceae bacterium]
MRLDGNSDVKFKEFGLRAREARKNRQLTMRELAERIGISENFLARIESDNGRPGLGTVIKICNELKVSMDFLFQDSLHEIECETINLDILSGPDRKFIIRTVENLKAYRDELDGKN